VTRTLLTGGRVFDGTGAAPGEADVLVEDGRTLQAPFSYRFFETVKNLAATLAAGITMVRDAAGADAGVKKAVADGLVPGPRLQISVTLLSQTGGHGDGWFPSGQVVEFWPPYPGMPDGLVDGPEAMRRKVRELIRAGADVIKVATSGGVLPDAARRKAVEVSEAHADSFRRAVAAGVKVAMGTDSGVTPHGRNLAELELMAKGGMEPAQALAAASSSAAELLGVADELGTLEPGKRADVVVVDGDPFELATLSDRIAAVVKDGRLVAGHV
jgi:imidazolonepropionase-like amidohydrolase